MLRRVVALLALLTVVACKRGGTTTTVVVRRDEVAGLEDSVSGPAPAGIARQLVRDSSVATPAPATTMPIDPSTNAALEEATRTMCAESLRDPASGARFVARRTQVFTSTTLPKTGTSVHTVRGWGDYEPVAGTTTALPAGVRLRVDCATNTVAGIAPAIVTGS